MPLQPIDGFIALQTHHCVTGSLRHIYEFYGYPVSEELLLGLGAGVGFIYWHAKGTLPFLGGRANIERPGVEGLEKAIGRCTGVAIEVYRTGNPKKAEKALLELLTSGQPVMLILDMGYLPYFDFGGQEFHFGYHVVVACGYDPESRVVLLADRDAGFHPVALADLAKARGSQYKPFPPRHAWYTFNFSHKRQPTTGELRAAIRQCAAGMLQPPIRNFGVAGIRKAAQRVCNWPTALDEKALRETCINTAIMIDARGGTGGGLFRYMYARFLRDVASLLGEQRLISAANQMLAAGDCWEEVAKLFEQASSAGMPGLMLDQAGKLLLRIADLEEAAWTEIFSLAGDQKMAAIPTT